MPSDASSLNSPHYYRREAAALLDAVWQERMEARQAINQWPTLPQGEEPDASLSAALQAVWFFEADEDRHRTELFYLDAQIALIRQMAVHLADGRDLPPYLLQAYKASGPTRFYQQKSPWRAYWEKLIDRGVSFRSVWRQTWASTLNRFH